MVDIVFHIDVISREPPILYMNFVQISGRGLEIWEIFYCYIKKPEAIMVYILRLLQGFNWLEGVQW